VVGYSPQENGATKVIVVIEINDSHLARGSFQANEASNCPYCSSKTEEGLDHHCPSRQTVGIDRLPGGFAPYILAPSKSIVEVPKIVSSKSAILVEPFAAALQAIYSTPPRKGYSVAVLGPRRLGFCILAALSGYRSSLKRNNIADADFEIVAVGRHDKLLESSKLLGADRTVNSKTDKLNRNYDIVFDTTGTSEGFKLAMNLTKKTLHLKSTSGFSVFGITHLTQMVVDEISLLAFSTETVRFSWPGDKGERPNRNIYVSPTIHVEQLRKLHGLEEHVLHQCTILEAYEAVKDRKPNHFEGSPVPQFDLAIVSTMQEVDRVLRPVPSHEISIVRPKGAILLCDILEYSDSLAADLQHEANEVIASAILQGSLEINTSRCGDIRKAVQLWTENPDIPRKLEEVMITHCLPLENINEAFDLAKQSDKCVKVVIQTRKQ